MQITEDTVRRIATLAQLELPPEAIPRLATQIGRIVEFVEQLSTAPMVTTEHHEGPATAPLRDDSAQRSASSDTILDNAPGKEGRFFTVPQVIA